MGSWLGQSLSTLICYKDILLLFMTFLFLLNSTAIPGCLLEVIEKQLYNCRCFMRKSQTSLLYIKSVNVDSAEGKLRPPHDSLWKRQKVKCFCFVFYNLGPWLLQSEMLPTSVALTKQGISASISRAGGLACTCYGNLLAITSRSKGGRGKGCMLLTWYQVGGRGCSEHGEHVARITHRMFHIPLPVT